MRFQNTVVNTEKQLMTGLEKYKRNIIIKALIIPFAVTLIAVSLFLLSLPDIKKAMPNGVQYSQQESALLAENGA